MNLENSETKEKWTMVDTSLFETNPNLEMHEMLKNAWNQRKVNESWRWLWVNSLKTKIVMHEIYEKQEWDGYGSTKLEEKY